MSKKENGAGRARLPTLLVRGRFLKALLRNPVGVISLATLVLISVMSIFAPALVPRDPFAISSEDRFRPPSAEYWMGTDNLGRDVASRTIYGSRVSVAVGTLTALIVTLAGTAIGGAAGYYRRVDNILMRVMDGLMAFPSIIFAMSIMAILGPGFVNVIIALCLVYTPRMARVVRGSVLLIREMEYVEAIRALGGTGLRILARHILPNCLNFVVVQASFIFAYAILSEASLSFIGAGTPPQIPTWGTMLSEANEYLRVAWWLTLPPGLAIMVTVLSVNLVGDSLRDSLDPRLRTRAPSGPHS